MAVEREGVFAEAVDGIKAAKAAGFLVCTNTTIYKETDMHEIAVLFSYLTELGVDGFMISPAYGYEAVQQTNPDGAAQIFMTRDEIHEKFRQAKELLKHHKLNTSPIYLEFLCGERELPLRRLGQSDAQRPRLEGPLLSDHRQAPSDLPGSDRVDRLGQARAGERSSLRALHGALRLRARGRPGGQQTAGRHAENGAVAVDVAALAARICSRGH